MNQEERNRDLERVIEDYSNSLYKICFMILKNEQDTKDVLQETFITYMTKKPDFKSEEHRKAWLIKVSQNKCKEFLRFHKKHAGVPLDEVEERFEITNGMNVEDREKLRLIWDLNYKLKSVVILYYVENLFPEQEVQRVKTVGDWDGNSVCYVEEDNLLHLPDAEMSDDQLLMFIDYSAKKDYVIEKEAEKVEPLEPFVDPYVDVETATEEDIIKMSRKYIVKFLGKDLGSEWSTRVEAFKPSESDPSVGLTHDCYTVYFEQQGATPNSTDYVVGFGMHKLDFRCVAVRGREHWAGLKSYTKEEALKKAESDKEKVYKQLQEKFGLPQEPDEIKKVEAYEDYGEGDDIRQIRYIFKYGDMPVDILWDLADENLAGVEMVGNIDLGYELGEDFE